MSEETSLPSGWALATVGDLAQYVRGVSYDKTQAHKTPSNDRTAVLRANNLVGGYFDTSDLVFVDASAVVAEQLVQAGDIVFAMSSGSKRHVGKSVLANRPPNAAFGAFCGLLRPNREVSAPFLAWQFQGRDYRRHVQSVAMGTNINNLKSADLLGFRIVLAPLREQHRIVAKIEELFSELDNAVESLTLARAQLKTYRQALLKAAFEGKLTADWRAANPDKLEPPETLLARIRAEREARYNQALDDWQVALSKWRAGGEVERKPKKPARIANTEEIEADELAALPNLADGWSYCRLAEFLDDIEAGNSFACDEREPRSDEIGVAKVSAISWGEYEETESKTCRDPGRIDSDLFIREGDFLLSRANTIELVGACVLVGRVTKRVMLSDKTLRLRFGAVDPRYFLHYLRSVAGRAEIEKRSTGNQESMRNIGQDRIRSIVVPICSPAEAMEVVLVLEEQIEGLRRMEDEIDTALIKTNALRQSILKQAFSGRLVHQDPADEPASTLLARLREQAPTARTRRRKTV